MVDENGVLSENNGMPLPLLRMIKKVFSSGNFRQGEGNRKSSENRRHTRYRSFARVKFPDQPGGENILKDISVTGCRVECTSLMNLKPDTQYTLEMIPEAAARIGAFNLEVKPIWIRPGDYSSDVGFIIVASPKGKLFQRYVDYLAWREAHPDRIVKSNRS
jgi:hypothetical protein